MMGPLLRIELGWWIGGLEDYESIGHHYSILTFSQGTWLALYIFNGSCYLDGEQISGPRSSVISIAQVINTVLLRKKLKLEYSMIFMDGLDGHRTTGAELNISTSMNRCLKICEN